VHALRFTRPVEDVSVPDVEPDSVPLPFSTPSLIGVVHLLPLPGSALHRQSMAEILARAEADARTLANAGFDAIIVENYGDVPFARDELPPASLAALAIATHHVGSRVGIPVGVNALRNDARGALGIAAATGASFIRVNVHTGVAVTDQGIIEGKAHHTIAYRRELGRDVAILADVHVKHAAPLGISDIAHSAQDTAYRGLADALVVSGAATGLPVDGDELTRVREAVPSRPLLVGSGATSENVRALLSLADGVIVGTGIKSDGVTRNPIDPHRAQAFVEAARS
jgi:membrane complex biogenesis BtpA family protein